MKHLRQQSSNLDESHNPALPDKKKPWCLNCRLHTNWYSVLEGRAGKEHKVLCCEVCDAGQIYCPIRPTKSNLISIAIAVPFFLLGSALIFLLGSALIFLLGSALIAIRFDLVAGELADEEKLILGLGSIEVGIFMAYTDRNIHKQVIKHRAEFHKWAEDQSGS